MFQSQGMKVRHINKIGDQFCNVTGLVVAPLIRRKKAILSITIYEYSPTMSRPVRS